MRNYEDIRNHERYQLKHHTPMSLESRAAQFAPFAALVGYDEEIGEAARSTDGREELSEDAIDALNQAFQKLIRCWLRLQGSRVLHRHSVPDTLL